MAAGRMYVVESDTEMTVVRALSPSQSINHVCQDKYKVRVATADDVAEYLQAGGVIEKTKAVLDLEGADAQGTAPDPDAPDTGAEIPAEAEEAPNAENM